MIGAEQPQRVVPARVVRQGWPYDDPDVVAGSGERPYEQRLAGRSFPCGYIDGGYLYGPAEPCYAADVLIEDYAAPPHHSEFWKRVEEGASVRVTSTQTRTEVTGVRADGLEHKVHTVDHPKGLAYV